MAFFTMSNGTQPAAVTPAKSKLASIEPTKPLSRFTFSKGNDLAATAKAPVYALDGILETDSHGVIYGASMSYKSFTVLEIAHCICNERDFMGHKVKRQGAVIYVCGEGEGAISRRIKAQIVKNREFVNNDFYLLNGNISIDNDDDMSELKRAIAEIKPVLVIFDTFSSLVSSTKENDNDDVARVLRLVKETCRNEHGTSSIIVHHTGKDDAKGMRGASAFKNNVDFSFELKRGNDFNTAMVCEKMKDGEDFKDIHMAATVVSLDIYDDDMKEATSLVMQQTQGALFNSKKAINSDDRKVLNVLQKIIDDGESTTAPPKTVMDLFPDNPEKAPTKVTTVRSWLDSSYEVITVTSELEKEKQAKRVKFDRVRKKLYDCGYIGVNGDYIWMANAPQSLQPA